MGLEELTRPVALKYFQLSTHSRVEILPNVKDSFFSVIGLKNKTWPISALITYNLTMYKFCKRMLHTFYFAGLLDQNSKKKNYNNYKYKKAVLYSCQFVFLLIAAVGQ